jgi:hypothetical protein
MCLRIKMNFARKLSALFGIREAVQCGHLHDQTAELHTSRVLDPPFLEKRWASTSAPHYEVSVAVQP